MASTATTSPAQAEENASRQELQETVSRLSAHPGVCAVMVLNREGDIVVESGFSPVQAKLTNQLLQTAKNYLTSLREDDEVSFIQVRSKSQQEIMISPHQGYVLAVLKR